jgi:hypothetical protein
MTGVGTRSTCDLVDGRRSIAKWRLDGAWIVLSFFMGETILSLRGLGLMPRLRSAFRGGSAQSGVWRADHIGISSNQTRQVGAGRISFDPTNRADSISSRSGSLATSVRSCGWLSATGVYHSMTYHGRPRFEGAADVGFGRNEQRDKASSESSPRVQKIRINRFNDLSR